MQILIQVYSANRCAAISKYNNKEIASTIVVTVSYTHLGYRVGFFSSPHLYSYQERIRINEQNIPQEDVVALVEELAPHLEGMAQDGFETPTEFEINTVMALLYFDRQQVDWAVIETGLGGAIDSTNVILPEVAVITLSLIHI